ncbi:hypothetical protein ACHAXS_012986 [Conticribra weissflogii]
MASFNLRLLLHLHPRRQIHRVKPLHLEQPRHQRHQPHLGRATPPPRRDFPQGDETGPADHHPGHVREAHLELEVHGAVGVVDDQDGEIPRAGELEDGGGIDGFDGDGEDSVESGVGIGVGVGVVGDGRSSRRRRGHVDRQAALVDDEFGRGHVVAIAAGGRGASGPEGRGGAHHRGRVDGARFSHGFAVGDDRLAEFVSAGDAAEGCRGGTSADGEEVSVGVAGLESAGGVVESEGRSTGELVGGGGARVVGCRVVVVGVDVVVVLSVVGVVRHLLPADPPGDQSVRRTKRHVLHRDRPAASRPLHDVLDLHGDQTGVVSAPRHALGHLERQGDVESIELPEGFGAVGDVPHFDAENVLPRLFEAAGHDGVDSSSGGNVLRRRWRRLHWLPRRRLLVAAERRGQDDPPRRGLELHPHRQSPHGQFPRGVQHAEIRRESFSDVDHAEGVGEEQGGRQGVLRGEEGGAAGRRRGGGGEVRGLEAHHFEGGGGGGEEVALIFGGPRLNDISRVLL